MTPREISETISEKTRLPLSLVLSLIALIVVVVLWAKGLEARVDDHIKRDDQDGQALAAKVETTQELFHSIDRRLSRIEGALKIGRNDR